MSQDERAQIIEHFKLRASERGCMGAVSIDGVCCQSELPLVDWCDECLMGHYCFLLDKQATETHEERWQPIETMPKDGPPFLVYWQKSIIGKPTIDILGRAEYDEVRGYGEPPARAWMPLPPPPVDHQE